jgi:hypothetical protein
MDLDCGSPAVLAKADELGLPRPESDYWSKKKFGDLVEIPESILMKIAQLRLEEQAAAPA